MCEKVESILKEIPQTICEVTMDGKSYASDDFVTIMSRENGDASIFYNTDAVTLGMAMKMIAKAFVEAMSELSEEERESVQEVLGDALIYDKPTEVQV